MSWLIAAAKAATLAVGTLTIGPAPPNSSNTITLTAENGVDVANYPFQFGRPFIQGAIPHAPQVLINGAPAASQADIKNRYPDGSVEFAVMAVQVPPLSPNACDLTNYNPAEMPPFALWPQHGNTPVFNVPPSPNAGDHLQNTLTAANCGHFDGGQGPISMITTENTAATSDVGGEMGFTEYAPYGIIRGSMFSSMICKGAAWCVPASPNTGISVGLDEENGGAWPAAGITPPANGDVVIGVTSPGGDGIVTVYANGAQVANQLPQEPLLIQGNLVWGSDGDHTVLGPVIGFDQIYTHSVLPPASMAALSAAMTQAYSTGTGAVPCSIAGATCDIAISVTQQLVAGATKGLQLYRVSDGATQDIGFTASHLIDTGTALAFCGTAANCRYRTAYDQQGEVATAPNSVVLSFQDTQAASAPLSLAQMEAMLPVGAASMTLTPGGTADAGQMLLDGNCKPWTSGAVAQTMICGDDTAARKYDLGIGDGFHPFRPHFYVTFWPATNQIFVRAVGEDDLPTEHENLKYKLAVSDGYVADLSGDQATNPKIHWANTRWSHSFWLGGVPPAQINIDANLAYLDSTRFLPNLDTTAAAPFNVIFQDYQSWLASAHDIYDGTWDGGEWIAAMGTAGDSHHIGPFPLTTSLWLHNPDWRLRLQALNETDLAAAWPLNWRESDPTRIFQRGDVAGSGTGLGRALSAAGRPNSGLNLGDDAIAVGDLTKGPWSADTAHQPSVYFPAYVMTGDPWYLDMLYAWAGTSVFADAPASPYVCLKQTNNCSIFRGPTGAYGGLDGSSAARDVAWTLRGRAETAFAAPDGAPEKSYFTYMTNDAIAKWEGGLGLTGTPFDNATVKTWVEGTDYPYVWTFNQSTPSMSGGIPLLGNMASICCGSGIPAGEGLVAGANGTWDNPWMNFYLEYAVGRAVELGFRMEDIQAFVDQLPIGMIASPSPWVISAYVMGVREANGTYWPNWPAYLAGGADPGYLASLQTGFAVSMQGGYSTLVAPGLAMAVDDGVPGAGVAWAWYNANAYSLSSTTPFFKQDPRWAIVPRTDANVLPDQPITTPP